MKTTKHIFFIFLSILMVGLLPSCEKDEGTGGRASISGKVFNSDYDPSFSTLIDQYYAPEADVYIVYGNENTYGDKVKTNYDGSFSFEYLRAGNYTIYAYSDDSTRTSTQEQIAVKIDVSIDKKENKTIADLNTLTALDYDDGSATISGKVYKINYNSTYTSINAEFYSPDEDVFIVYNDDPTYFEKTKTRWDGSYSFSNLLKGTYQIYAYSEDRTQTTASNIIEISKTATISSNNELVTLEDLVIFD